MSIRKQSFEWRFLKNILSTQNHCLGLTEMIFPLLYAKLFPFYLFCCSYCFNFKKEGETN